MSWNAKMKKETERAGMQKTSMAMRNILVHTNPHHKRLLDEQLATVSRDKSEALERLQRQKRAFVIQTAIKETEIRELHLPHRSYLPEIIMKLSQREVYIRRPIVPPKRSSTHMMREIGLEPSLNYLPELTELPDSIMTSALGDTMEGSPKPTSRIIRKMRLRSAAQGERHYGIDLPLYGKEQITERKEKKTKEVSKLQKVLCSHKAQDDPRFVRLEESLIPLSQIEKKPNPFNKT